MRFQKELEIAKEIAHAAGEVVLSLRGRGLQISIKPGGGDIPPSAVTSADLAASDLICEQLRLAFPDYGIVSEETFEDDSQEGPPWWNTRYAWIIDPLDGTKDYIIGGRDFGILIGLTEEGVPVLGVSHFPDRKETYWATAGEGAFQLTGDRLQSLALAATPNRSFSPLRSSDLSMKSVYESVLDQEISELTYNQYPYFGSTGLRICVIAQGLHPLYISTGTRGGLWDVVAGDIILKEAGGLLGDWEGNPIDYRRDDARLSKGVVACADPVVFAQVTQRLKNRPF